MMIDPKVALAGLFVGFVVGLTGMGGGALMTPILVLLFKVQPLAAVSSDIVASMIMKPVGRGSLAPRDGEHRTGEVAGAGFGALRVSRRAAAQEHGSGGRAAAPREDCARHRAVGRGARSDHSPAAQPRAPRRQYRAARREEGADGVDRHRRWFGSRLDVGRLRLADDHSALD